MAKGEVNNLFTIEGELLNKDDATLLEHPNPQARRDSFLNLNGLWDYVISDKDFIDNYYNNVDNHDDPTLVSFLNSTITDRLIKYEKGDLLLTDDKAPVELLGIKVIDTLIDKEVSYYKKIYKENFIYAVRKFFRPR